MAAAFLAVTCFAQTILYDATADFTPNLPNPNGVWAYGYTTDLSAALTPFAWPHSGYAARYWPKMKPPRTHLLNRTQL